MIPWLKRLLAGFRAWRAANAEAHARSTPRSYCSAPPPGAVGDHEYGEKST